MLFSLEKSTSMIEEQDMAVDVKMEESCKSLSESESPSLSVSVLCSDSNDDETLIVPVFDKKSQITTSTPSTVVLCSINNNIMVEEVVCFPPKKRAKKFNPVRTMVAYMRQGNKYFTVRKQIIITSPAFTL